ncbi:MAG: putative Ig domain-containing protein [Myxococcales bacterium]|nr:putative Ig domain-containing protein [Myxococcales bacterium]
MNLGRSSSVLLAVPCAVLLVACGDDEGAGSSATYTTTSTSTSTSSTTDATATDTDATTSTGGSASDSATTSTSGETTAVADPLVVECGAPPMGAEGADYTHVPSASGGVPGYMWAATGLPDGLSINEFSGAITGQPTLAGDYEIELTVTDKEGTMAMTTCPLVTVGGKLSVDLEGVGPCIKDKGSLLDYIQGGDGSEIVCSTPGGTGNGKLPAGITVDPGACTIQGSIAETRYGTWVWIVRAAQSGVEIYVPYCATQDQQGPDSYKIIGTHSGGDQLTPAVATFDPDQPVKFDGDGEPHFEITTTCGNACFYGYYYGVSSSPFGGGACKDDADGCYGLCPLVPDPNEPDGDKQISCTLLPEMGLPKEGFSHELWSKGDVPADDFKDRPWVLQWSIDYCISTDGGACTNKANILANGKDSNLEFAVIMQPAP